MQLKCGAEYKLIRDFSKKPFSQLKILDLACGEGVYSIEAALRGEVKALDARIERMREGAKAAERLGLKNLCFEQADIRNVNTSSHGGGYCTISWNSLSSRSKGCISCCEEYLRDVSAFCNY